MLSKVGEQKAGMNEISTQKSVNIMKQQSSAVISSVGFTVL
jgi:hypothetical protein